MVYQFPLAPLILHTFLTEDARTISQWATTVETPSAETAFFNFTASHDGIGVRPVEGILTSSEIEALVKHTIEHDGRVSFKRNSDGSQSVFELNITLYDFLNDPHRINLEIDVRRFLASQAVMLSLAGVPGIYVHSLFGSSNCYACLQKTGRARTLNREKFEMSALRSELADPDSKPARVLSGYLRLLEYRKQHQAFHPHARQEILNIHPSVFALKRGEGGKEIICLTNVSPQDCTVQISDPPTPRQDLFTKQLFTPEGGNLLVHLTGYQTRWLVAAP
jgi:sucrose phosphorylase